MLDQTVSAKGRKRKPSCSNLYMELNIALTFRFYFPGIARWFRSLLDLRHFIKSAAVSMFRPAHATIPDPS